MSDQNTLLWLESNLFYYTIILSSTPAAWATNYYHRTIKSNDWVTVMLSAIDRRRQRRRDSDQANTKGYIHTVPIKSPQ